LGDEVDDADLEAELQCLEDELEGEELGLDAPAYLQPSALPVQPNSALLPGAPSQPAAAKAVATDEYGLPV
jgi:charged multivesicular body protein 5